jgi:glycosyltransferase involved in cell wall biosynthesis
MSLSILIPIYNYDVKNLVDDLHSQCLDLNIDFEMLLVDDCSLENFDDENKRLESFSNVIYERLENNIGRSKIRNYLVSKAKYNSCLILDCDIAIQSKFIKKYLKADDLKTVIVGGHMYQSKPPIDTSLLLHWKYGRGVEAKILTTRLQKPYNSFMTNSFLVPKQLFKTIKFDETILEYGHEDTIFGIELEAAKIKIKHIDNPVIHLGLKTAKKFLEGEKKAIQNLIVLSQNPKYKDVLYKKSRLLYFEKSILLNTYFSAISMFYKNKLYKKLLGENPSIPTLNFWKFYNLKKLRNQMKG